VEFLGLLVPFTLTSIGPVVPDVGTVATICESFQLTIDAAGTPLKVTVLLRRLAWKPEPFASPRKMTQDVRFFLRVGCAGV